MANQAPAKKTDTAYYAESDQAVKDRTSETNSEAAEAYLWSLQTTEDLNFKAASGYWANTYVPGDANMRWIQSQLLQAGGLTLPTVRQNSQPFDHPTQAALALYVHSDHQALDVSGPTRMRLQVGIQAGQQQGGHRAAMNLAVVLDLGEQPTRAEVEALLTALLKAKQPADQLSVFVTGEPGGMILAAADFRHGPIQVALDRLFAAPRNDDRQVHKHLLETVVAANQWVKKQDDPSAVLGSSAVLLVSAGSHDSGTQKHLETQVQQQAIAGITFSTLSLGAASNRKQLHRLALLGQGHSRVMNGVTDAQRVINDELKASSRAVARALRLQIRLADDVQLIDVLGSYSLTEAAAQKVREAEQSLDQRMAKNLGIEADRGQDDEGIQMVIPSFFAGDTHVILLDVLVNKPGPVVDVTARYKDLIYLRNATSRKNLELQTDPKPLGPLALNVMKNVLAHRFSQTMEQAGQSLQQGRQAEAASRLKTMLELYQSMRHHIPAWHEDPELQQDEQALKLYLQLLHTQAAIDPNQYLLIADSMSYLSWRKLLTHSP